MTRKTGAGASQTHSPSFLCVVCVCVVCVCVCVVCVCVSVCVVSLFVCVCLWVGGRGGSHVQQNRFNGIRGLQFQYGQIESRTSQRVSVCAQIHHKVTFMVTHEDILQLTDLGELY